MIEINDKEKCCGCTACMSICPKNAIKMCEDEEGFKYPIIDKEKCINCGLCSKVCPIINNSEINDDTVAYYVCQNLDTEIRSKSTSGGLFHVFAKEIISNKGIVYATGFDDEMNVIHKSADNYDKVLPLLGSKYVQSDLKETFREIKNILQKDKSVLFVGTPCQVAGLLNFIPKNLKQKLLTIDLMCYGVPSPGIYRKWIDLLEKKYKSKITSINFRDKKYGYSGTNIRIKFENNRVLEDSYDAKSFLKTMFSNIGLRPSCYECKYRNNRSGSDITIGDMVNIYKYSSEMDDNKGTTFVQIHTKKGKKLFETIENEINYKLIDEDDYIRKLGKKVKKMPEKRNQFFEDYSKLDYNELVKKYFPYTKKDFISNNIKPVFAKLPYSKQIIKLIRIKRRKK